ncbi:serine hydrolase domain-containing protein [Subtercola frigoramans]|uniref:CubicO group peptidase (Beta-lactamase class C family) n=1 Tax=Subtercola frigoramans TaxID=120298 RepID=A0ABS2L110_9MICO|nr:serine hydrolase domain-containing protein [Subtercola frigoramans]MBM7470759.1 CubicO group peptidase (beta-lactamase class C family) [Subtercola frigoramans]
MSSRNTADDRLSIGLVETGFESVRNALDAMLLSDPQFSAQVTAIWRGHTVVDLVGGPDLAENSVTGVFSATKGVAAAVIGLLLQRGFFELDKPVASYWPEFAARDKAQITVRQVLSHRAGLVGIDERFAVDELIDSSRAAAKLAETAPQWQPGATHGYHGITIGIFMEELTRRLTGRSLQEIYESEIRAPRGIDFYLGLPESEEPRFREVLPPAPSPTEAAELSARAPATDSIQALAFNVFHGELAPTAGEMGPNNRRMRASGFSSINGIGSARGLAGVYGAVLGGPNAKPLLSEDTIEQMSREQSVGADRVLVLPTSFAIVYMKPNPRLEFGSYRAFGHDGAGGVIAFADPIHELAFGYVPMPMQLPGGADPKGVELSRLVRACIRRLR